jgi:hypothetical protein
MWWKYVAAVLGPFMLAAMVYRISSHIGMTDRESVETAALAFGGIAAVILLIAPDPD